MKRNIGITLGDPFGIGPEIVAKALSRLPGRTLRRIVLIGHKKAFEFVGGKGLLDKVDLFLDTGGRFFSFGVYKREYALSAKSALDKAVDLARQGRIYAIVTAPVNKEKMNEIIPFSGHTEYFQKAFKKNRVEMFFVSRNFNLLLATRHVPLRDVCGYITKERIREVIEAGVDFTRKMKINKPIAVCGVNPHAGEGGLLGREELEVIGPVVKDFEKIGVNVSGPLPADTLFRRRKDFALIIAMYHDQGLGPLKTVAPNAVNLTWGLDVVRTSPSHGTAFDIRGANTADFRPMLSAIKLAFRLM